MLSPGLGQSIYKIMLEHVAVAETMEMLKIQAQQYGGMERRQEPNERAPSSQS